MQINEDRINRANRARVAFVEAKKANASKTKLDKLHLEWARAYSELNSAECKLHIRFLCEIQEQPCES